jgi:hypothetical protein
VVPPVVTPTTPAPVLVVAPLEPVAVKSAPQTPPATASAESPAANVGQSAVKGAQVVRGNAALRGKNGCATRAFFAHVTGNSITRVTFTLDGRRIATATRATTARQLRVQIHPGAIRVGSHRLVAKVEFRSPTAPQTRLLSLSFRRCATIASGPQFAG